MKAYLTFLSRNKLYTAVNVVGLSVSLTFVIIIGLYAQMELGRDRWHAAADRIYALCNTFDDGAYREEMGHWAEQQLLVPQFPDVEASCALAMGSELLTLADQEQTEIPVYYADGSFFQMFDFPLTAGDRQTALANPDDIIITESLARLLFGQSDPMGKTVTLRDSLHFTVSGVMPQLNHTYLRPVDAFVQARHFPSSRGRYDDPRMNSFGNWQVFFLAREGADLTRQQKAMNEVMRQNVWLFKDDCTVGQAHLELHPLKELYFYNIDSNPATTRGDRQQAQLLLLGGIIILLFAVANYVNLTLAQSRFRQREMAMRRLLGSQRWQVAGRMVVESIMLSLLSLVLALVLVRLVVPFANQLLTTLGTGMTWVSDNRSSIDILQYADLLRPLPLAVLIVFTIVLGVVAGLMPAVRTSAVKPLELLKPSPVSTSFLTRLSGGALIIFQHVITAVLLGVTLTMTLQMRHLVDAPLGYNHERLMEVRSAEYGDERMLLMLDEVRRLACVEDAALGLGSPLHGGSNNTCEVNGRVISWQHFRETESWMKMLDLKVIADYGTTGPDGVKTYITPNALSLQGLPPDARTFIFGDDMEEPVRQVDGLIEPMHLHNILDQNYIGRPQMVTIHPEPLIKYILMMRYRGSAQEARRQVGEVFRRVFERDLTPDTFNFYDDQLRDCYADHLRILHLVEVFTAVAFVIALLGLLAMSTLYIQRHRRDVAVRKVFGATNGEVLRRLLCQFLVYVVVAVMIATPVIYWIAQQWLEQFSYRIALSPWIFVVSGLLCLLVSLFTVLVQSWRVANENPVGNIKTE